MAYCKKCIAYTEEFSKLCADNQDSVPIGEKPKENFCIVFPEGIPEKYWSGEKGCPYIIGRGSNGVLAKGK